MTWLSSFTPVNTYARWVLRVGILELRIWDLGVGDEEESCLEEVVDLGREGRGAGGKPSARSDYRSDYRRQAICQRKVYR